MNAPTPPAAPPKPPERRFYILNRRGGCEAVSWWRDECRGYTNQLDEAGTFSESEVRARWSYFNTLGVCFAVPVEMAEGFAARVVPIERLRDIDAAMAALPDLLAESTAAPAGG